MHPSHASRRERAEANAGTAQQLVRVVLAAYEELWKGLVADGLKTQDDRRAWEAEKLTPLLAAHGITMQRQPVNRVLGPTGQPAHG